MTDFTVISKNLEAKGYHVSVFPTARQAALYLDREINHMSVGFGGSMTLKSIGLWDLLHLHNTVYSHLDGYPFGPEAANAQIYITSANGIAETGEIVNIDAFGNRVAGSLFGHERVYFVIGRNKITPTCEDAVQRARNIAAPKNAQRKKLSTPCALRGDRCYNCNSPDRICCALLILWQAVQGMETEVVLVDEDLGF